MLPCALTSTSAACWGQLKSLSWYSVAASVRWPTNPLHRQQPVSQQSRSADGGTSRGPGFLPRQCLQISSLQHTSSQHGSRPRLHQAAHLLEVTLW